VAQLPLQFSFERRTASGTQSTLIHNSRQFNAVPSSQLQTAATLPATLSSPMQSSLSSLFHTDTTMTCIIFVWEQSSWTDNKSLVKTPWSKIARHKGQTSTIWRLTMFEPTCKRMFLKSSSPKYLKTLVLIWHESQTCVPFTSNGQKKMLPKCWPNII
jgi:hypothetical protein